MDLKKNCENLIIIFSGLNCLAANSEIEFDHCVARLSKFCEILFFLINQLECYIDIEISTCIQPIDGS